MTAEHCFRSLCFEPLYSTAPRIYAFPQFIAGLTVMALTWTLADGRYRFRVRCARVPIRFITFGVVAGVGTLTLLTDLWYAEHWLVPRGPVVTPSEWEAFLAALFLLAITTWAWLAFMNPPRYGKRNAKNYARTLYSAILQGSLQDLPVIADELIWSARSLVHFASDERQLRRQKLAREQVTPPKDVEAIANALLLLIGDRRFCRTVVQSSPGTALAVFEAMLATKKFGVPVQAFACNIVSIAVATKDCFIYTEAEGYNAGLLGYHKPLTQAMFSSYELVATVGRMFEPDWRERHKWDAEQWEAFYRVVLMTFEDYAQNHFDQHAPVLYSAMKHSEEAVNELYKLNGQENGAWDHDALARLRVTVKFFGDALDILDKNTITPTFRVRDSRAENCLDRVAECISDVIWAASGVRSPRDLCWSVQHNAVWRELFSDHQHNGTVSKAVRFKVRRLIYDDIVEMDEFPNFKGARILGFCLNVMGLREPEHEVYRNMRPLQRAVLNWTKKHFAWIHSYNASVAEHCLVEGITYDAERRRITSVWPVEGLRRKPHYVHLDVDPPAPDAKRPG